LKNKVVEAGYNFIPEVVPRGLQLRDFAYNFIKQILIFVL